MPELNWNAAYWSGGYDWTMRGEEWSAVWGSSEAQWFGSLYPRLHRYLGARSILEIAPGFGRWTKYLLPVCETYVGIDLSSECVGACRDTFGEFRHARFFANDGLSLEAAGDSRFDFVFSFDSLVHVESDVLESYIPQILAKMTPDGVAFMHHSDMAALAPGTPNRHARGESVSAEIVADMVRKADGDILVQERINWGGGSEMTDCLTLFAPRRAGAGTTTPIDIRNNRFMQEASIICDTQAPWNLSRQPSPGAEGG